MGKTPLISSRDMIRLLARDPAYQLEYKESKKQFMGYTVIGGDVIDCGVIRRKELRWGMIREYFDPEVGKKNPDSVLHHLWGPADVVSNPLDFGPEELAGEQGDSVFYSRYPFDSPQNSGSMEYPTDIIFGRYLVVRIDLAYPWKGVTQVALEKIVKAGMTCPPER